MARKHDRTKARRSAAQALYTSSIRNIEVSTLIEESLLDCLEEPLTEYALLLLEGVQQHKEALDEQLSKLSENWAIDRMPVMDLNILRIALFEMIHIDEVPISVSINEAVELAKDFGGDDNSPKFINGMLGNIARQMEGEAAAKGVDGAASGVDAAEIAAVADAIAADASDAGVVVGANATEVVDITDKATQKDGDSDE